MLFPDYDSLEPTPPVEVEQRIVEALQRLGLVFDHDFQIRIDDAETTGFIGVLFWDRASITADVIVACNKALANAKWTIVLGACIPDSEATEAVCSTSATIPAFPVLEDAATMELTAQAMQRLYNEALAREDSGTSG